MIKSKLCKGFLSFLFLVAFACIGEDQISVYGMETEGLNEQVEVAGHTFNDIFPDENLAAEIATFFSRQPNDKVTIVELNSFELATLDLRGRRIRNLEGMQHLTSVSHLDLSFNEINDVERLRDLTNLWYLNLYTNQINDIEPLRNLTNLRHVDLSYNQINDIEPLRNLPNLRFLYLNNNQINDVEPLGYLTNLTQLTLNDNQINDSEPLGNLPNLTYLNLSNNRINDVQPLRNLTYLRVLALDNNQINDVEPLKNLTNLVNVGLSNNQINDVKPLCNLTNLTSLRLDDNQINDVEPLGNLTSLTSLSLDDNQINDVEPIRNLTSLRFLYLHNNQINDVEPLRNLPNLVRLHLDNNQISDLTPVQHIRLVFASKQNIILDSISYGDVTSIFIRNKEGQTPSLTLPETATYYPEVGRLVWGSPGDNSLSWSDDNFSGTVTQYVEEQEKLTFLDFFPDENLAQIIANRFSRQVTDIVTEEELNHLSGIISGNFRNISHLEGMQYLTGISQVFLNGNAIMNDSLEPLTQLPNLMMLFLDQNQITDLSVFSKSTNPLLTISAINQCIALDPINEGELTEGIFIRSRYEQTPSTLTFNPIGGSYQIETGRITWTGLGKNTLTWSDDHNFSGTITQVVNPS